MAQSVCSFETLMTVSDPLYEQAGMYPTYIASAALRPSPDFGNRAARGRPPPTITEWTFRVRLAPDGASELGSQDSNGT